MSNIESAYDMPWPSTGELSGTLDGLGGLGVAVSCIFSMIVQITLDMLSLLLLW